jgi:hypothetical protein
MMLPEKRPLRRRPRHQGRCGAVLRVSIHNGRRQARCTCRDYRSDQMCGHVWIAELMQAPLRRLLPMLPSFSVFFLGS